MSSRILLTASFAAMLAACGSPESGSSDGDAVETSAPAAQNTPSEAAPAADTASANTGARPKSFAQCIACHQIEPGKHGIGPSLAGVYGAEAGHVGEFAYSTAMRGSGLIWDDTTLDAYLENPRIKVPGTKMSYAGLKDADQRAELIEYLKTL